MLKLELPITLVGSSSFVSSVSIVQGEYLLLCPQRQEVRLRYGDMDITLMGDQAVLVPPAVKKPVWGSEHEGRIIRFRAAPFLGRMLHEFHQPIIVPYTASISSALDIFQTDLEEPVDSYSQLFYSSALYTLITEILHALHKHRAELPPPEREASTGIKGRPIIYAVRYMTAHLSDADLDLPAIASAVNYHPNYFCEEFKAIMGVTPMRYLKLLRMKAAVRLLETTEYTVKDVCRQVGINKPDVLALHIRQMTGLTPIQYRQKQRAPQMFRGRNGIAVSGG